MGRETLRQRLVVSAAFIVVVVCVAIGWWVWFATPTTVLLVRHAERAATPAADPGLTPAGQTRANELARVAGDAEVVAIFHSEFQRTRLTVEPLAVQSGLTPVEISAGDTDALVDAILSEHRGHTVLVAGHSNTVPEAIEALGAGSLCPLHFALDASGGCLIPETQFDNLFVVSIPRWGARKATRLRYGAPTP